jgi:hypothetical protein
MAKKKQLSADDVLAQMYPDLMTSDDFVEEKKEEKPATGADAAAITALQQQIANLNSQLANVSKVNSALSTQVTVDAPPARPVLDMSKAPDPLDDPKGYAKFVHDNAMATVNYEKEAYLYQQRQQQTAAQRQASLWASFSTKYAPYAKNDKQVEIAATQVLNRLKSNGIDTDKYMTTQSEDFMKDVAAEIDGLFGKPKDVDADEDDDDDDRTDVFGGGFAGAKLSAGGKQAPPQKYGALGTELKAWQEKTGFHR